LVIVIFEVPGGFVGMFKVPEYPCRVFVNKAPSARIANLSVFPEFLNLEI
jgi:hypothetical protein